MEYTHLGRSGLSVSRLCLDSRLAQTAGANPSGVFTSDLSAQDFFRLLAAGAVPVALPPSRPSP